MKRTQQLSILISLAWAMAGLALVRSRRLVRRVVPLALVAFGILLGLGPVQAVLAEPAVPGFVVDVYADVQGPMLISFDPNGVLYVGRDLRTVGISNLQATTIHRIGPGGSPVTQYGNANTPDPDAVLFDAAGVISGTPGSVLVAGRFYSDAGSVSAILPDQSVVTVFGASPGLFRNPHAMVFDDAGRLIFSDYDLHRVMVSDGNTPTMLIDLSYRADRALSLALDGAGSIYTSTNGGAILVHDLDGNLVNESFATGLGGEVTLEFGPGGGWGTDLYAIANGNLLRFDTAGNATTIGTGFASMAYDMEFGPDNSLYVSELWNDRILKITIPEPGTLSLLCLGAAVVLRRWRRNRFC